MQRIEEKIPTMEQIKDSLHQTIGNSPLKRHNKAQTSKKGHLHQSDSSPSLTAIHHANATILTTPHRDLNDSQLSHNQNISLNVHPVNRLRRCSPALSPKDPSIHSLPSLSQSSLAPVDTQKSNENAVPNSSAQYDDSSYEISHHSDPEEAISSATAIPTSATIGKLSFC